MIKTANRKMKDSGIDWIGEIPEDWICSRVKYYVDCYDGQRIPIDSGSRKDGPYPYWGAGSITDYIDRYLFDEELVLLGEDGAPFFDKTRDVSFLIDEKVWINNHIHVLKPKASVLAKYVVYYLNTVDYKIYINGSILNKLTQNNMNNISFLVPDIKIQEKIIDYLDTKCSKIDAIIEREQTVIEKLKEYKLSVITEAVTKGLNPDVEMKDSGIEWIGEIPKNWKTPKLKYLASISSGGTPDRNHPEYWGGDINWIKTGELQNNELFSVEEHITREGFEASSAQMFDINTILMAMYGQGKTRGMTALLKVPSTTNQACAGIVVRSKLIKVKFLWKALIASYIPIREKANGSGQPNLSQALIGNFNIPLPSIEEQDKIVHFINGKTPQIDATINQKQSIIDKLTEYKKSLIYECVTGKREV